MATGRLQASRDSGAPEANTLTPESDRPIETEVPRPVMGKGRGGGGRREGPVREPRERTAPRPPAYLGGRKNGRE